MAFTYVVLLSVLLGGADELHGSELVAALLEAADDVGDEATLDACEEQMIRARRTGWRSVSIGVGRRW